MPKNNKLQIKYVYNNIMTAITKHHTKSNTNKTILLVDDDNYLRQALHSLLLQQGYRVVTYNNPHEGINFAISHKPDLILIDYVMDGMSGLEAANLLKKNNTTNHIPIIIMSANYLECRKYMFLQKPISTDILYQTISQCMNSIYI